MSRVILKLERQLKANMLGAVWISYSRAGADDAYFGWKVATLLPNNDKQYYSLIP